MEEEKKSLIKQIEAKDVIAIIVITGCIVLLALGKNSFVTALLAFVVGSYFSYRHPFIIRR